VAVFGPTDPTATSPAGAPCTIIQQSVDCAPCTHRVCPRTSDVHQCMTGVSVANVLAAAEAALTESCLRDPGTPVTYAGQTFCSPSLLTSKSNLV